MEIQTIGELIDNCAEPNFEAIVSAGLTLIVGDEVTCKVHKGDGLYRCDLFVRGNLAREASRIAELAMAIPTLDDNGQYGNKFLFDECEVYVVLASWLRTRCGKPFRRD